MDINYNNIQTFQGCVSCCSHQVAPSAAQMSPERRPELCSKGDAHVEISIELESAWLPVHS